jgi:hypothetical protein
MNKKFKRFVRRNLHVSDATTSPKEAHGAILAGAGPGGLAGPVSQSDRPYRGRSIGLLALALASKRPRPLAD